MLSECLLDHRWHLDVRQRRPLQIWLGWQSLFLRLFALAYGSILRFRSLHSQSATYQRIILPDRPRAWNLAADSHIMVGSFSVLDPCTIVAGDHGHASP